MSRKRSREEALNEMRRLAAEVFGDKPVALTDVGQKPATKTSTTENQQPIPPVSKSPPDEIQNNIPNMPEIDTMTPPPAEKEPMGTEKKEKLNIAEEKIYLILTMLYRRIMEQSANFQVGYSKWYKILPEKLREYGITAEEWTRISEIGDNDPKLQEKMEKVEKSL